MILGNLLVVAIYFFHFFVEVAIQPLNQTPVIFPSCLGY